jgi:beta-mannosidase
LTDLCGEWSAIEANDDLRRSFPRPELDDSNWQPVRVPGHWQAEPRFAASDGPLLYRRHFEMETLTKGQRAWLVMDGIFYQSDVWLDGSYLGDTEGYFFPHAFEVTSALEERSTHLLGLEVVCGRTTKRRDKRALTGVFGNWDCIDPAFNPGGIWGPARIVVGGSVHISSLRAICVEARAGRAVLDMVAELDAAEAVTVTLRTEVRRAGSDEVAAALDKQHSLALGANRLRWRLVVPDPELWWPVGLGEQPLYDLSVSVELEGQPLGSKLLRTGLRQVRAHDFIWSVNGERAFLKGANLAPTRRDLAYASPAEVARDVELALEAGLNMLRVHGHVGRPELYATADKLGVLIWQDMPLQWAYKGVRREAVRQAAKAVDLLGHHPSIAVWCGHNEPFSFELQPGGPLGALSALGVAAAHALPSWNKSVLDSSIRRAFERADPSRPVVAHSGVLPHPAWGTDSHFYFGWYLGRSQDLPRALAAWPAAGRFVGELGAQAVPTTAAFMRPDSWPDLDWGGLEEHFCLQKGIFDNLVPPASFATFEAWRDATQDYQASLIKQQVETLRRLKFRPTGGFAVFCLNDSQPAVTWSLLDHERVPKAAFAALKKACAPVLVVADWPAPSYSPGSVLSVDVHVVNDLREVLDHAVLEARLIWPGGGRAWRFAGEVSAGPATFVGRLIARLPEVASLKAATAGEEATANPGTTTANAGPSPLGPSWPLALQLQLRWAGSAEPAANRYESWVKA